MEVGKIIAGSSIVTKIEPPEGTNTFREMSDADKQAAVKQEISEKELSKDDAKALVESLNSFLEPSFTNVRYEYHEKLEEYYVTVVDPDTDEIVKEIPPKKLLDVYASMAELMGFIVDEKI
ncbi:flagellar protein FlaG [Saliterribacillus persicus]|uniref:Flagellar protein FlaG n=1 Tax=Saliterribacillus persicus TaxID=930114 RepID=A0A368XGG6_9BACI|nr:flagellar protein FlaG [Saliterribacillus persicus]RCW67090.1 flagellar protein FlaG [Saliterribacillus persicus]